MNAIKWILSIIIPLLLAIGILLTFVYSVNKKSDNRKPIIQESKASSAKDNPEKSPDVNDKPAENGLASTYRIQPITLPDNIGFAGEQAPLYDDDVRERLERELLVNTYWQSHTLLLLKRANRWLPIIEDILVKNDIPKDFKYVPIAESDLRNVVSPAGAVGYWQFMEATGKERGLEIRDQVDERYDIRKATEAACDYLKKAHEEFGNWTLVAASFNLGISGVKRNLRQQKANSYYDLRLNPETSRYVFRILAMKAIIENPERYGFFLDNHELYQPYQTEQVTVNSSVDDWVDFAKRQDITYKTLKNYNPWIQRRQLTNRSGKAYQVDIPIKKGPEPGQGGIYQKDTLATMPQSKAMAIHGESVEEQYKSHRVKEGQTIHKIAKNYQVRVPEIMEWNNLNTSFVKRGQTLKILKKAID